MQHVLFIGFFLSLLSIASSQIPTPGSEGKTPLTWASDFDAALKLAEKESKPIVMDVTTDWCGWSKKMDRETFADSKVQEQLKGCILVRLNPEASDINRDVAKKYEVTGYPTLIVANFKGEVLAQDSGYQSAEDFNTFLKDHLAGFKKSSLGYEVAQLPPDDSLVQALTKLPKPEVLPSHLGSILLLDQTHMRLDTNYVAQATIRSSYYVIDPDREPVPYVLLTYTSSRETVKLKAVRIVNAQGQGRVLNLDLAKDEHAYSNQNVYWDVRKITLDVPPLKAGDILDVIEERELRPIMPGHFSWRWATSSQVIVVGDLKITFPEKLGLTKQAVRCTTPMTETKAADGTVEWRLLSQNINEPAPEVYTPSKYENWQGYDVFTTTSWDSLASWFRGLCSGRDTLPEEAKTKIAELKKTHSDPSQLLQALFDWVTKDVRYVGVHFGESSHQPHPVSDTLKNRYGDCKDQALLLQSICREAGIPTSLVLLGTGYGRQFDNPNASLHHFNHCILEARVGDKSVYLDPSGGPSKAGRLSVECSAVQALRIGEKAEVISLPSYIPEEDCSLQKTIVKLNPNGSSTITEMTELKGAHGRSAKLQFRNVPVEKIKKRLEEVYKENGQKLLDFTMTDPNDESDLYHSKITYTLPRFASKSSEGLIFKLGASSEDGKDWTATLEAPRNQPFRFYPNDPAIVIYEVEMPEGAVLKSKPEDLNLKTKFLDAARKVTVDKNKITLTEVTRMLDAKLAPTEAQTVLTEFRKLEDHREHAFIVSIPTPAPATPTSTPTPPASSQQSSLK
jgi:thioredoxin-related protein